MTCLPASLALSTLELLAGRVVPVPFNGSTMVEGTVCPTTASSLDAEVRGILAAGLEKAKTQIKTCKSTTQKYSIATRLAIYLSLAGREELLRFLATDRVLLGRPVWVSTLGVGLSSLSLPARRLLICTIKPIHKYCLYEISYKHTKTWLIDREVWKNKRVNKCLVVKDYS